MPGGGTKADITPNRHSTSWMLRYRRRLIRKRLLWRAFRARRDLRLVQDNHTNIPRDAVLCFTTFRNESMRLPHFLQYYRKLGVGHFFMVDNASDDDSTALLLGQDDVTLYRTDASYRASRFGVDWLNWLKRKYAHGHWVLVADADELLVYPECDTRDLPNLTARLRRGGHAMMGAIMLDMYPKGSPDAQKYTPGQDPLEVLPWFDAYGYWVQRQPKLDNLWLQGGARARMFFDDTPDRAPTLNKIPLVDWKRSYVFVNSTHSALPSALNHVWETPVSGALLHTKFLPGAAERAAIEAERDEHFHVGTRYLDYYQALTQSPDLWFEGSQRYDGWAQLVELGLIRNAWV